MKQEYKTWLWQVQQMLDWAGATGLQAYGLRIAPIDKNPRHGLLSVGQMGPVEVVQRQGQWWVMPQRKWI